MIRVLLWDIDNTLLNFNAAEEAAICGLFAEFRLGKCSPAMLARYSRINRGYWEKLERKEMSKPEILVRRFEDFFSGEGLDPSVAEAFNREYQLRLGDTIVFNDNSYELVHSLSQRVKQYAVSNGTVAAQSKKLRLSGLGALMDGIFLSEELGAEKPDPAFFAKVFAAIPPYDKGEILIVGDSLTGDMQGGLNAGIKTCWYNPGRLSLPPGYPLDYQISNLNEVVGILE